MQSEHRAVGIPGERAMISRVFTLVMALLILPAGRLVAMPLDGSSPLGAPLGTVAEAVCVPPGLPPFSTWQGGNDVALVIEDETRRPVIALERTYTAKGQSITTFWVGRILVSVDPAPDDPRESGWHDRGAVTQDTALLAHPVQACQWFHALPHTPRTRR